MFKVLLLSVFLFFASFVANAQQILSNKKDSSALKSKASDPASKTTDTAQAYINVGKIAGRRAALRSAMLPGLGQIRNGFNLYRGLKVAGIYTGATLLTISYIDNSEKYNTFLNEIKYRQDHNDQSEEGSPYRGYPTSGMITAKDISRRNKQVIILSYVGLYLFNIIEAYIDARLANFDVGDIAFKVTPGVMNSGEMYGFNSFAPGLKIAISL